MNIKDISEQAILSEASYADLEWCLQLLSF